MSPLNFAWKNLFIHVNLLQYKTLGETMKLLLAAIFAIALSFQPLIGKEATFADFSAQILAISNQPTKHVETTRIFIVHPMVKDKETKMVHTSKLEWKDDQCTRTFTDFKQLKGNSIKGDKGIGKTVKFAYISDQLKKLCNNKNISKWQKFSSKMKLNKKAYWGFRFFIEMDGGKRECSVYTNDGNELAAIGYGFPKYVIPRLKGFKETATTWFFSKQDGKIVNSRIEEILTQKKNGIPIVKKSIEIFE